MTTVCPYASVATGCPYGLCLVAARGKASVTCGFCRRRLDAERERVLATSTADLKARQARRRELKPLLADILRRHGENRPEFSRKILSFVGFDLPGEVPLPL